MMRANHPADVPSQATETAENEVLSDLERRINEARGRDAGLKDEIDALKEQSKKTKDKQRDILVRVRRAARTTLY